jgi:hypothetical protein
MKLFFKLKYAAEICVEALRGPGLVPCRRLASLISARNQDQPQQLGN